MSTRICWELTCDTGKVKDSHLLNNTKIAKSAGFMATWFVRPAKIALAIVLLVHWLSQLCFTEPIFCLCGVCRLLSEFLGLRWKCTDFRKKNVSKYRNAALKSTANFIVPLFAWRIMHKLNNWNERFIYTHPRVHVLDCGKNGAQINGFVKELKMKYFKKIEKWSVQNEVG